MMLRIFAVLAMLPLTGCVQSAAPLDSGGRITDPALIGQWKTDLDGDPMIATFRQETNGELVADLQAYWEPGPKAATKHFQVVLAQFGEYRYVSVRDVELSPNYLIARYVFEGKDRFCLHTVSSEALIKDLEGGVLPGKLIPDRHISMVQLDASTEQLRGYFSKHGARAFHDQPTMAFERVSAAVLPQPRTQLERDHDEPGFNEVAPCRPEQNR
jgi:hypothetical protein